jgi:hypothetical protein
MNQFGMQMPGGKAKRGGSPDVYTALMFVAVVCLAVASAFVYVQGSKVGKEGSAFAIQEAGDIKLKQN